jgi:phage-related minor tail protein
MAAELASAYVSILPSAQGFGRKLSQELDGIMPAAGKKAGDDAQGGFVAGFGAKAGIAAVGVAVAAVVSKAFSDALDVGAANDKLAAQLGASGDFAADLGKISGELYANAYGDSVGQVNEALKGVLQNGLLPEDATNEQIEGITAKVLDLSTAFDQDLGGAAAAVSQLIRTGLAPDADAALDIITRGFQQGADKSGDLLDTFTEYGTQFRKLGIDGAAATGLLVQGLQAGARDADIVADAIKEFSIRAVDGSELTAQGFQDVGLNAKKMFAAIAKGGPAANDALDETLDRLRDIEDPVKRSQVAVKLFGTQAEDLGDALFALDLDTAAQGLGNIEGAAAKMGDTLNDNASTKIEAFKRQALGGLTTFIGNTVIPGIESLVAAFQEDGLAGVIDKVGQSFRDAWPGIQAGLSDIATSLGTWITETAPEFGRQALALGSALVDWIGPKIPPLLAELAGFLGAGVEWLATTGLPLLAEGAAKLVPALINWIKDEAIPGIVEALPKMASAFSDWVTNDGYEAFRDGGVRLGKAVWHGFQDSITSLFGDSWDFLSNGEISFELPFDLPSVPFPGRASGGPVSAGQPYIVGERRPELFVPSTSGTVLPSVPSGFGGSTFVQNIYNPLPEQPSDSVRALRRVALEVA